MLYNTLLAATALLATARAAPLQSRSQVSFDYNNQKVLGVNLGGWFVLEPWITPSIFSQWANGGGVVDEYTLSAALGKDETTRRLTNHWNTWIQESDFQQIANAGLNHVRIPIGYWAVNPQPGDPYIQGQLTYLDKAVAWAEKYKIKVMLDLHGAPGSQNGFDNSGRKGPTNWSKADPNRDLAKGAIATLVERYASSSAVTMIEAVNEPLTTNGDLDVNYVKQYYYDVWGKTRQINAAQNQPNTVVVIHDGFQGPTYWNGFMNSQAGTDNIALDTHIYQIFTDDLVAMTPQQHVQSACSQKASIQNTDKWTIVGEWTGAQTDCALWLNGLGVGARYDGTFSGSSYHGSCDGKRSGTVDGLSSADKQNIRQLIEAQLDAYESHTGWIFWTWKNEAAPEWHMQNLTAAGLFPQPLSDRKFGNQCA